MTHTPGPWELRDKSGMSWGQERIVYDIGGANNRIVALVNFGDFTPGSESSKTSHQDAKLIAAAPEMLEALKELVLASYGHEKPNALRQAEAAIRKAETL